MKKQEQKRVVIDGETHTKAKIQAIKVKMDLQDWFNKAVKYIVKNNIKIN